MATLMVQIDGQTLPLADCFWVRFDNTGCAVGSTRPVAGGDVIATAEQAHRDFQPRQRDRDRDDRRGYTHELLTREQWKIRARPCFLRQCQHHPAIPKATS